MPRTFIAAGQCDPLRSDSTEYATRLATAGVPTTFVVYEGMTHNFITLSRYSQTARHFLDDFVRAASAWADGVRA